MDAAGVEKSATLPLERLGVHDEAQRSRLRASEEAGALPPAAGHGVWSLARGVAGFSLGAAAASLAALYVRERERLNSSRMPVSTGWPRVVVVGAGFGGLRVARGLAGAPAEVLVLDKHNYHCFQPLLYQVATAALEPEEIAHPVRRVLQGIPNVRFRMGELQRVDLDKRQLQTSEGPIDYDYLVLAAGSTTNFFGVDELAAHAHGLKDLDQAVELRNHVLERFEHAVAETDPARRAPMLSFVVGGGGPTGVEFAGALAELIRLLLSTDYVDLDPKEVRITLVEGADDLMTMFVPALRNAAVGTLKGKGVDVRFNAIVTGYDGRCVRLKDGSVIEAQTLVWAAGVKAVDVGGWLGLPLAKGGRVPVSPSLQLDGHPEVYVIGDLANVEEQGQALPMVAPVAIQQGEHAARNIRQQLQALPAKEFHYSDKGTMATIGRNFAVAQIGWLNLTGFPAWIMWLMVHLLQLIGFRNRLLVVVNWAWDYLFFDRAVRLITKL